MSQPNLTKPQDVTPPPSIIEPPLTPPSKTRRNTKRDSQIEFQVAKGEFDQIQSVLLQDGPLLKFVAASIRYDYDEAIHLLVVRMPTGVHEFFIDEVEDDIRSQLKAIRNRPDRTAQFKSRYHPDISFGHKDARFPGLIVEVAFSQDYKQLRRLAENYLLDSDANVRVVVGINIAYDKVSRKATISIWRPKLSKTPNGYDLEVEEEVMDEVFRDDEGNSVEHTGTQLCQYVATAENNVQRAMREQPLPSSNIINKRRRSTTPPKELRPEDRARYVKQEKRATKRGDYDVSYEHKQ
ncbi:hypothetical protein PMIN01_09943 [Paraphaeosphaeria minitans]|uniref:Uncharacterized protein n=1 Tax=Paraphaeosphaeria minitans TaxID=565426 RepID=A0A9P6GAV4_9PLEO|nr:hypothetical protein PMIN01_09943 [Paraphaeosphaeria minitans]